jgi:hypothetical protein
MESRTGAWSRAIPLVIVTIIFSFAIGFSLGRSSTFESPREEPEAGTIVGAAATLLGTDGPACDEPIEPITILQDRVDGPVGMVATWFEQEQALAQTFTAPRAGLHLIEFAPTFDYALGEGAVVSLHAVTDPRDPMSGRELMRLPVDSLAVPSEEPARIRLDPPVPVACGAVYGIVIRPKPGSELSIQSTAFPRSGNVYTGGAMFMGRPGHWSATGGDMRFSVLLAPAETS